MRDYISIRKQNMDDAILQIISSPLCPISHEKVVNTDIWCLAERNSNILTTIIYKNVSQIKTKSKLYVPSTQAYTDVL